MGAAGRVTLSVNSAARAVASSGVVLTVNATAPGVFATTVNDQQRAILVHPDFTPVTPDNPGRRDRDLIGPNKKFLCGDQVTIADYFGAAMLTAGETVRCDFSPYPNIQRWIANMKALPGWKKVNEVLYFAVMACSSW